jgi:TRAP-type C4-dicarboxylate transport system permease small subunit
MIRQSSQISIALEIPMWIVYSVIPIGTLLMAIALLLKIGGQILGLFAHRTDLKGGLNT